MMGNGRMGSCMEMESIFGLMDRSILALMFMGLSRETVSILFFNWFLGEIQFPNGKKFKG